MCLRKIYVLTFLIVSLWGWAQIDTRVGTAHSVTKAAGMFGKGTEELGQTLPAVLKPHGMNFWTPQTRDTEIKCIAPYYYADSLLQGFRGSHWIVGGCTQDYGSFTLMPLSHLSSLTPERRATPFSHDAETALPHYYSVELPEQAVTAEMTGDSRSAIFRFTYDNAGKGYLVVNPNNDEEEGFVAIDPQARMIYGYNPVHRIYQSKGEPAGFSGHFVVMLDRPITAYGVYEGETQMPGVASIGHRNDIGAYVEFEVNPDSPVLVKAASSFTSHHAALQNLLSEIPTWDFDGQKDKLAQVWQQWLGTIEAEGDPEVLQKFYTAMYHASFLPHEVSDVDGSYVPFASGYPIKNLPMGQRYFDDYSAWDTYRALHPLIHLLHPEMGGEMVQSLVRKYDEGGWMPIFPCWNSYTCAMIGDHCSAIIADAYVKGIRNFDAEKAYQGIRRNAFEIPSAQEYAAGKGRRAIDSYLSMGYVPVEDSVPMAFHKREQTSRTLEYAYDDFAAAQLARALGHYQDADQLLDRSRNYHNVINPATGYADGRHADGSWAGSNPVNFSKHITEGAPCHYTWYVPHDPEGLMIAMGGKKAFTARLDSMFSEHRYWHGNEPCHQVAFMYAFTDQPWKASREVRHIMDTEYLNCPGGLSGNDDAGQMSAWLVFATLGFYPVCPGTETYAVSGPALTKAVIHLENGNTLTISAPKASAKNIYVKSLKFNGQKIDHRFLNHSDLLQGGTLEFEMSPKP